MLKDTFCSSPWFHLRVTYNGDFESCRWARPTHDKHNISTTSVMQFYNSDTMKNLRLDLLNANAPKDCSDCYYQDKHGKVSGRLRQLNKSGIDVSEFDLTARSSPHYSRFQTSYMNDGYSDYYPVDLQIDLGNICNSACIMCSPEASTRLQQDYKKLHKLNERIFIQQDDFTPWTRKPELLDKFITELESIPNIRYIHFLGGETLYDSAFYTICDRLIASGLSKNIIVGTTTNGTIYDDRVEALIGNFKEFHLGISIESVSSLNDYIRYPSTINEVTENIHKFLELRKHSGLQVSLRITPNVFTIYELDELFEFMIDNSVVAESCNILSNPQMLRMEIMPEDIRLEISDKLTALAEKYGLQKTNHVNVRRNDLVSEVIANVILEYKTFIDTYTVPENAESLRHQLVEFIKGFETLRNNSILDYAPRYEKFLRTYGY
jgi:MoaA/NifB/PqqE/SkfB family radical SAM enzyme